jgi:hypothetical protein
MMLFMAGVLNEHEEYDNDECSTECELSTGDEQANGEANGDEGMGDMKCEKDDDGGVLLRSVFFCGDSESSLFLGVRNPSHLLLIVFVLADNIVFERNIFWHVAHMYASLYCMPGKTFSAVYGEEAIDLIV